MNLHLSIQYCHFSPFSLYALSMVIVRNKSLVVCVVQTAILDREANKDKAYN